MPNVSMPQQILNYVTLLSPQQILILVIATSAAMFLLIDKKISTALLLLQYLLLPQLLSESFHKSVLFTRLGAGFSICLILYLTPSHMRSAPTPMTSEGGAGDGPVARVDNGRPGEMGVAFRLLTLALGAFTAYHLWRRYPLPPLPPELTLTSYWLISGGILMSLVSLDPLRMGFGLLSFMNGFAALYLFWEPGFLVTALLNVAEVLLAVGVVLFAEGWLQGLIVDMEMEE